MSITYRANSPRIPVPIPARTRLGQRWLDLSLRRKLYSVVALVAVICVPSIAMGLVADDRLREAHRETGRTADAVEALDVLQDQVLLRAGGAIEAYVLGGFTQPDLVEEYRDTAATVPDLFAALAEDVPDDLAAPLAAVGTAYDRLVADLGAITELGAPDTAALDAAADATEATFDANSELRSALDERLVGQREEVDRLQDVLVRLTLASLVLAMLGAAGGTYMVTSRIVRRIVAVSDNGLRFVHDRPVLPVPQSRDEVGQLDDTMAVAGAQLDAGTEEVLAATQAKDAFLSRVSHELKTPLTAMIGFAQLLQDDEQGLTADGREITSRIIGTGHHLHELIEELLDLRAVEEGKLAMTLRPVMLGDAVAESAELVRQSAADRAVDVATCCPEGVMVIADRRRLLDVLASLLSNAVGHSHPGGRVDLVAEPGCDTVRIEVTDAGPGISPRSQRRLFEPSGHEGAAGGDDRGGGVGLVLTKNLIEAMDGTLSVRSQLGQGSTFRIELPIAPATPHDHGLDRDELVSRDTGHAPERPPGPDTHLSAS